MTAKFWTVIASQHKYLCVALESAGIGIGIGIGIGLKVGPHRCTWRWNLAMWVCGSDLWPSSATQVQKVVMNKCTKKMGDISGKKHRLLQLAKHTPP